MNQMLALRAGQGERREAAPRARLETQSTAAPGVCISVYDDLPGIEARWRAFEASADCTVFQTFDYLATWQAHIGMHVGAIPAIVTLQRADRLLAILPLAVAGSSMLRRLTWLGQDPSDYLAPLLARDFSSFIAPATFAPLWREIRALIGSDPSLQHDVIDLRRMPATVGAQPNPFLALATTPHPSDAYAISLHGSWDDFYAAKRPAKARRQERAKRKRLAELGHVRMVTPQSRDAVAAAVATLFAQKSAIFARKGIADRFRRPGYREFFLALATGPRTRHFAHVSLLEVGDKPAAVNFGLEHRGSYALCLVSYDERLSRSSPGTIHLNELISRAITRGLSEFDFLVGSQRLKREWSDRCLAMFDHFAGATLRGRVAAHALRAYTALKRTIKTTPALWHTFVRARALVGALRRRPVANPE